MAISENVKYVLEQAQAAKELEHAIVIGKGKDNQIQLFIADCDKEKMIVLLERAKLALLKSMDL